MVAHLLKEYSSADLPDTLQDLLDPSSQEGLFLPEPPPTIFPSLLWTLLAAFSSLLFAIGIQEATPALARFYGLVALGCAVLAIRPARRAFIAWRARLELMTGRYRRGLYMLPEGLLLWTGATATWIPRDAVEALQMVAESGGPPYERMTVLRAKDGKRESVTVPLATIPPRSLGDDTGSLLFTALEAWFETGRFEPLPTPSPPWRERLRPWLVNLLLGHMVLAGVGIAGLLALTTLSHVLGRPMASLTGLLLGVPLFIGFPAILHRAVGPRLRLSATDGRAVGWGYLSILGLSALFLIVVGGTTTGALWWQLRADEAQAVTYDDLAADSAPTFFQWPESLRPLSEPVGYDVHRLFLGDASWVESSAYVAPLVDDSHPATGCLWIGLSTDDGSRSSASIRRLLNERSDWLVQASGLEISGFEDAVDDAVAELREAPSCVHGFKVLTASPPRHRAIQESVQHLALLHALVHGLPLLVLCVWVIGKLDRRRPEIQDRRSDTVH